MSKRKEFILLIFIFLIAAFLRFYNLMHDSPYFFNPDERNMANAITLFRLPSNFNQIPACLINQLSQKTTDNRLLSTNNCNLNPHFFAYGQFPLYLAFISDQLASPVVNNFSKQPTTYNQQLTTRFDSAVFWLRFWSALSSTFTVLFVFLISRKLFTLNFSLLTALITAFLPGSIQASHFGTTESFLSFFFMVSIYLSLKFLDVTFYKSIKRYLILNTKYLILISLTVGLALGSKLTGLFFLVPPILAVMIKNWQFKSRKISGRILFSLFHCFFVSLLLSGSVFFSIVSSPYNAIDQKDFWSAVFGYEADVASGKYDAFYTRQFVDTTPILFQMEKVFPYALGWPVFILGTMGFLLIIIQLSINVIPSIIKGIRHQVLGIKYKDEKLLNIPNTKYLILTTSFILFLIPNSFLFVKWTRFMTPIFPFIAIFAGFSVYTIYKVISDRILQYQRSNIKDQIYLSRIKKVKIFNILYVFFIFNILFLILAPGIAFFSIYTHEDSRVQASRWIYKNIPDDSYILSETANVIDIPVGLPVTNNQQPTTYNYKVVSFDFYHMDENPLIFTDLIRQLERADYIFIPSRRIFANYPRIPNKFPLVTKYYQLLFSDRLGFEKVTQTSSFPSLTFPLYPKSYTLSFSDESAEESFTVFDHPVVRIYKKTKQIDINVYKQLFDNEKIDQTKTSSIIKGNI